MDNSTNEQQVAEKVENSTEVKDSNASTIETQTTEKAETTPEIPAPSAPKADIEVSDKVENLGETRDKELTTDDKVKDPNKDKEADKVENDNIIDLNAADTEGKVVINATDPNNYPTDAGKLVGDDKYIYQIVTLNGTSSRLVLAINRNDHNDESIYAYVTNSNYSSASQTFEIKVGNNRVITVGNHKYQINNTGKSDVTIDNGNGTTTKVPTENTSTITGQPGWIDTDRISPIYGLGNTTNNNYTALGEIIPVYTENSVIKYYYKDSEGKLHEIEGSDQYPNIIVSGLTGQEFEIKNVDQFKQIINGYYLIPDNLPSGDFKGTLSQFKEGEYYKKVYYEYGSSNVEFYVVYNQISPDGTMRISLFDGDKTTAVESHVVAPGQAVAAGYLADNKTRPNWHDDKALTQIVNDQKLNSDGEAMGPDYNGYPATMDDLKKGIYDLMNSMIFTEGNGIDEKGGQSHYELGHAEILLGAIPFIINGKETIKSRDYLYSSDLRDQLDEINYKKEMAKELASQGIQFNWDADLDKVAAQLKKEIEETKQGDISVVVTRYDDNSVDYHFLRCTPESNSPYDLTVIPSYAQQIEDVKNQIQTKNNELNNLQKQEKESSNQENKIQNELLTPAKEKAHAANAKTKDLQNKLNTIGDQINKLDTQISTLNTQLKDSQATVSQNKGKLEILTADNQTKTANLEKAQTAQKQAQSELTDAQAELNNAQKTLDDAKKNLETLQKDAQSKGDAVKQAQTALETAQKHVEDLKNAPQILKNANDAKANAQTEYDAAKKALNEAEAQIKKLENEKSTADGQVATAQATYNEALTRLKSAQDKLAKAKEALNNIQNDQKIISTPDQKPVEKKTTKTVKKTTKSTKKAKKVSSHVRLTHNAFIYTKSGKAIRSGLHFKLVRRGKTVKALKNAKIVTIKGKRFYQIGKNQFIKVANAKIVTHAVHVKAVIKGKKAVRAYDRLGKLNKHSVKGGHTYTFNEKAVINGKTYYKIAWTNNWIPASKLNLKK